MWWYGAHHALGWLWIVFPMLWFLFWLTVVGLVVWLIRGWLRGGGRGPQDPGDIAGRRLASGEITAQEYNDVMRALKG